MADEADQAQSEQENATNVAIAEAANAACEEREAAAANDGISDEDHHEMEKATLEKKIAENRVEEIKATAGLKRIKANGKLMSEEYQTLCERGPENRPLLDPAKNTAIAANQAAPPADEDAWKDQDLSVLECFTDKQIEALAVEKIVTVGDLEELRANISNHKAEWPKGFGPKTQEKIEKAMDAFWEKWNAGEFAEAMADESAANPPAPESEPDHPATLPFGSTAVEGLSEDESQAIADEVETDSETEEAEAVAAGE